MILFWKLRQLSKGAYDGVVDGLSKADEALVDKALDFLPADDKTKSALKAAAQALLRTLKGERWKPPVPPLYQLPPSNASQMPKAPGEVIIPGPVIRW